MQSDDNISQYIKYPKYNCYVYNKSFSKLQSINSINTNNILTFDVLIIENIKNKHMFENVLNSANLTKKLYIYSTFDINVDNDNCFICKYSKISKIFQNIELLDDDYVEHKPEKKQTKKKVPNSYYLPKPPGSREKENFRNICLKNINKIRSIKLPNITLNLNNEAVFIEYRELPHSEFLIRNAILKLGDTWSYSVICGNKCYDYYSKLCSEIHRNIKVINSGHDNMTHNSYNNMLLTIDFWKLIHGEKVLLYQEDSYIFNTNVCDFVVWDYIGAPFKGVCVEGKNIGNGGLSLRSKSKLIEILNCFPLESIKIAELKPVVRNYIKKNNLDNIPEDIYFSTYMQQCELCRVADFESAKMFSSDTIFESKSFGMHCIWNGLPNWKIYIESKINSDFKGINNSIVEPTAIVEPTPTFDYGFTTESYLKKINEYCSLISINKDIVLNVPKEEFRYFCYRYLDYMRLVDLPIITQNNYYEAVLIEYRCVPHLEFLIRNCIHKLGSEWSQTIICGNLNYNYMLNIVKNIDRNIKVIKTNNDNITQSEYSLLLSSDTFWNLLFGEKILIYQEDTIIFKKNIMDFIKWDYIGAPWPKNQNDTPNCVGNGGLSLRSKSIMLEIIKKIHITETSYNSSTFNYMNNTKSTCPPEDVYFSKNMQELNIGKVADWDTAYDFSSESYLNTNSFGAHGVWVNNSEMMKKLLYKHIIPSYQVTKIFKQITDHRGGWNIVKNSLKDYVCSNSELLFVDNVDGYFLWDEKKEIKTKWFGFIHLTPITPEYLNFINLNHLFSLTIFKDSLINCVFLITLSSYITDFIKTKLNKMGINIPVYTMRHPTDTSCPHFTLDKYNKNNCKQIIQVGQQLRKLTSIYRLNTQFKKVWLTGFKDLNRSKRMLIKEAEVFNYNDLDYDSVELKYIQDFDEYDELLSQNIIFVDLFDAAANNAVVEAIARNTPILVNKLPAVVEYLGDDYPLYFEDLNEINELTSYKNINKAYVYLCNLNKDFLDINYFTKKFINILMKD